MKLCTDSQTSDLKARIRGRYVAYTGELATLSRERFIQIVEECGAHFNNGVKIGVGTVLVVVGQGRLPVNRDGRLASPLREIRVRPQEFNSKITVLSEEQFLVALGLEGERQQLAPLLTGSSLCEMLNVSRQRLTAWIQAELIRPVCKENGVWRFDFQQAVTAKSLSDLARAGASVGRIRLSLKQLQRWFPEMDEPLQQLSVLENGADLLVRLENGELASTDGQMHLTFEHTDEVENPPLRIHAAVTRTAAQCYEEGVEQESAGYYEEAAESYREALRLGGPDAQICFDLASVLQQLGLREQAMERYHQVLELDSRRADAWNNLGLILCELDRAEEACAAFRRALQLDPHYDLARFNIADTLDDLGRQREAVEHWRAYMQQDPDSHWGRHARARLSQAVS